MTPQDKIKYYTRKLREAKMERTAQPTSIDEVVAGALSWALDVGAETPKRIRKEIASAGTDGSIPMGSDLRGGYIDLRDLVSLYLSDESRWSNIDFRWAGTSGTLYEAILLNAASFIAEAAARLFDEEMGRPEREPDLEDYPLR